MKAHNGIFFNILKQIKLKIVILETLGFFKSHETDFIIQFVYLSLLLTTFHIKFCLRQILSYVLYNVCKIVTCTNKVLLVT